MQKVFSLLCVLVLVASGCSNQENASISPDIDITYSKGNANADVVVTVYGDYESSFCAMFALEILPHLQKDYIEKGKVRYVFKDYPMPNHEYSQKVSEATYCVGEQDESLYWQMHIDLFSNQEDFDIESLTALVTEYGINVQAFDTCLDTGRYKNLVLRNRKEGQKLDVTATPTIFVNEERLLGVQPYEKIKKVIEKEIPIEE